MNSHTYKILCDVIFCLVLLFYGGVLGAFYVAWSADRAAAKAAKRKREMEDGGSKMAQGKGENSQIADGK